MLVGAVAVLSTVALAWYRAVTLERRLSRRDRHTGQAVAVALDPTATPDRRSAAQGVLTVLLLPSAAPEETTATDP